MKFIIKEIPWFIDAKCSLRVLKSPQTHYVQAAPASPRPSKSHFNKNLPASKWSFFLTFPNINVVSTFNL
jgi:hypothetical protein